jgi:phage terminase small subunit
MTQMHGTIAIRDRLTLMADAGATLRELVAQLDRQRNLDRSDYDSLWLYCWALVSSGRRRRKDGDVLDYDDVGPG